MIKSRLFLRLDSNRRMQDSTDRKCATRHCAKHHPQFIDRVAYGKNYCLYLFYFFEVTLYTYMPNTCIPTSCHPYIYFCSIQMFSCFQIVSDYWKKFQCRAGTTWCPLKYPSRPCHF
ncbi:hypothetical protein RHMOL_Rhmol10G0246400 [Rhododendron molle]|uniref:Uncharacterized protein n=1 Tax=Rhododendron molle TaxID=49168 RepID=A0ACC0M644_RHOML|nr:hypothetical protein RHMOL_Rhmol10G0246400 [Rhododendron molle]